MVLVFNARSLYALGSQRRTDALITSGVILFLTLPFTVFFCLDGCMWESYNAVQATMGPLPANMTSVSRSFWCPTDSYFLLPNSTLANPSSVQNVYLWAVIPAGVIFLGVSVVVTAFAFDESDLTLFPIALFPGTLLASLLILMLTGSSTDWAGLQDLGTTTLDACVPCFILVGILTFGACCCGIIHEEDMEEMCGIVFLIMFAGGSVITFLVLLINRFSGSPELEGAQLAWGYVFIPTYLWDIVLLGVVIYAAVEDFEDDEALQYELAKATFTLWYPGYLAIRAMLLVQENFATIEIPTGMRTSVFAGCSALVTIDWIFHLLMHLGCCPCADEDIGRLCNCGIGQICPCLAEGVEECLENPCCVCERCAEKMEEIEEGRRDRQYARGGQAARLVQEEANDRTRERGEGFERGGYGTEGGGEGGTAKPSAPKAPRVEIPSDEHEAMLIDLVADLSRADTVESIIFALNEIKGFVAEHPSLRTDEHRKRIMAAAKAKMKENRDRWTRDCALLYGKLLKLMKAKKQRFDMSSLRQFSEKGVDSVRNAIGSFSNYSYSVFGRSNEGGHGGGASSRGGAARSLASHAAQDEFEVDIFETDQGNEGEDAEEGLLPPDLR